MSSFKERALAAEARPMGFSWHTVAFYVAAAALTAAIVALAAIGTS